MRIAHPDALLGRFDVDVGGPVAHGLGENATHDLDDRRIVGHGLGRRGVRPRAGAPPAFLDSFERLHEVIESADSPVVAVDGQADLRLGRQHRDDSVLRGLAQKAEKFGSRLIGQRNSQLVLVHGQRDDDVLPGHGVGDESQGLGLRRRRPEIGHGERGELAADGGEITLVEDATGDEDISRIAGVADAGRQREELFLGHETARHEELLETDVRPDLERLTGRRRAGSVAEPDRVDVRAGTGLSFGSAAKCHRPNPVTAVFPQPSPDRTVGATPTARCGRARRTASSRRRAGSPRRRCPTTGRVLVRATWQYVLVSPCR